MQIAMIYEFSTNTGNLSVDLQNLHTSSADHHLPKHAT